MDILEYINITPDEFMSKSSQTFNELRKRMSSYRMSESQKMRRKVIRHNRKKQDNDVEVEGTTYEARGFYLCFEHEMCTMLLDLIYLLIYLLVNFHVSSHGVYTSRLIYF